MLDAQQIFNATKSERNQMIVLSHKVDVDSLDELKKAQAVSNTINEFIREFIEIQIERDSQQDSGSILSERNLRIAFANIVEQFKSKTIPELHKLVDNRASSIAMSKNLFEMFGATKLASASKVSRVLSTKLGHLWEQFAEVSPYTVDPKKEFSVPIKGIDLIAKNAKSTRIEYLQIKTQKNTLTGGQMSRSVAELKIHQNSVFCVCFDNGASWTFSESTGVPRVCGQEFWNRIGIPYETVLDSASSLILELEREYVS